MKRRKPPRPKVLLSCVPYRIVRTAWGSIVLEYQAGHDAMGVARWVVAKPELTAHELAHEIGRALEARAKRKRKRKGSRKGSRSHE